MSLQPDGPPACFIPKEHGYRMVGQPEETNKGYQVILRRVNYPSWFGAEVNDVLVEVEFQADERLRIKLSDVNAERWEVPLPIESPDEMAENPLYDVQFEDEPVFSIKVIRKSTGAVIFDTSVGGLTFSDQFLQFSTYLNSANVYGFGEHEHHSFRHDMNFKTWPMWTRDIGGVNLYGHQPVYMNVEESHDAHMVLILNSNAADVTLMPAPGLTYRTIGGVLDVYFFLGPQPEAAVQQYLSSTGLPVMVPYWGLGFQLCRYGYKSIDEMKEAVDRMRQYDIPHDIQYGDIDYMLQYRDFTIDPVNFAGLPEYVDNLKQEGTRYIIILDPAIWNAGEPGEYPPYERGTDMDVWIKKMTATTKKELQAIYLHQSRYIDDDVWPGPVVFPDYTNPDTEIWWGDESVLFKEQLDYSGLWIDMNEPASFDIPEPCANNNLNNPMFTPRIEGDILTMTICMDSQQYMGQHYDVHSLYGWSMAKQTLPVARRVENNQKRGIVYSRSTFPGAGAWGQHWLGDNDSNWDHLRWSIIGMLEFSMFGFPYVGADICGFFGNSTAQLCQRWQQLGAFYTFSRNHNADGNAPQDPGYFGEEVARVTRESLLIRYTLLPYLYTLMYNAHITGSTVIRPMMFEFLQDETVLGIHDQFMWGPALLISPVLDEDTTSIQAYFPVESRWFSYYNVGVACIAYMTACGEELEGSEELIQLDAPLDFIPLHIRGGYVLPTQRPANTTVTSRQHPLGLIVALDADSQATGSLFWDDGEELGK
ncbi:hypothetical protein CAPTEDRAFT_104310 [Capitella teleta]|uniref:Uncharacterized protein n=1 Tax=Capitella teleta TaxID=283909 RepID=R7TZS5_CAPTE|nr:hypothetical protein CAPTEDRAFT_104310 [Capitella teleta]|eukprot:ELT99254.1 hypothetical protein CAPTEDRAFT_104310 [Capitella teleta]